MKICPNCNAENRPAAAFCSRCGTILLAQPTPSKPIPLELIAREPQPAPSKADSADTIAELPESDVPDAMQTTPDEPLMPKALSSLLSPTDPDASAPETHETAASQPLEQPEISVVFGPQSEGSIFGERFMFASLVYQAEHVNLYTVKEINQPPLPMISICSNSDCLTIHVPAGVEQEKFCTCCGHALDPIPPRLLLYESDLDQFGDQQALIDLELAHPSVHSPINVFQQDLPGGKRFYLVTPQAQELPERPETAKVIQWGVQLAEGLDYLHAHSVVVGDELDPSIFGLSGDHIVWANFRNARVLPMLADREKINNVRLLALSLYSWITGNASYQADSNLNPSLNRLFQQALVGEGITSGGRFAQQINLTLAAGLSPLNLDFNVGKRTHLGQRREVNEDSLGCFVRSCVQQGLSQPLGVFTVADGMGGHAKGELASSLTIQTILQKATSELTALIEPTEVQYSTWLKQTVQSANQAVYESRKKAGSDMGSTLVCALLVGDHAYITHLGDSRVYLLRQKSIQLLSIDHTLVQQLVTNGEISLDEARNHPQRNVILRCLGEKPRVELDVFVQELMPGDRLLLCSDGLSGLLDDRQIQIIIQESASPQVACDFLVDSANLAGGTDNISVILVEVILA